MSEKKNAPEVFDEIITSGEGIIKSGQNILSYLGNLLQAVNDLKALFSEPAQPAVAENENHAALPDKTQKKYTFEDVRGIMAGLSGQGKKTEAKALLQKYGVNRLSDLNENDYAAVAEEAKVIANG